MLLDADEGEMQYLPAGDIPSNLTRQDSGILHTIVRSHDSHPRVTLYKYGVVWGQVTQFGSEENKIFHKAEKAAIALP